MNGTLAIGRLVLTTCWQPGRAPMLDPCRTLVGEDCREAGGYAIRPPWRHRREPGGKALVLAWVGWRDPPRVRLPRRRRGATTQRVVGEHR